MKIYYCIIILLGGRLDAVVARKLERMGGGLEFQDFFPFELKIAIDQIVAEDVAAFQERAPS
jgi:hypothetical protein